MAARGLQFAPRAVVDETLKISVEKALKLFVEDESMTEYSFPSSLTNEERKYIHQNAPKLGLTTRSHGRAPARFITVSKKKEEEQRTPRDATIDITSFSHQIISKLLVENPLSEKERKELLSYDEKQTFDRNKPGCSGMSGTSSQTDGKEMACTTGRLNNIIPQIPRAIDPRTVSPEILVTRASLPIAEYRESIVLAISQSPVILISGDTGCGKTTQVPQFILEDCAERMVPCRILVAEPRRLAALSVAERVASERGEQVGQSVGFQIRLESKVSPRTLLTYCTTGVLLRTLMGNEQSLKSVTHIVVDEVHERDRLCDLLITVMREMVHKGASFKLIIMSATFDTERFVNYFNGCPVVKIPGKMYDVNYHFLEDILKLTGYKSEQMAKFKKRMGETYQNQKRKLLKWCPEGREEPDLLILPGDEPIANATSSSYSTDLVVGEESNNDDDQQEFDIPEDVKEQINDLLKAAWCDPSQEVFENLLSLYINEGVPVDYRHPETGVTALLVATCRGVKDFVESFLDLGANVSIRTALNDWNSIEWAKHFGYDEILEMLSLHVNEDTEDKEREADQIVQAKELSQEDKQLLEAYHRTFDDDAVDLELILCLIHYICINGRDDPKGAILVFLPGYDEIVTLRQLIIDDFNKLHYGQYVCFTLHSQMQSSDHRRVFRPVPAGTRKIILSTNIAETSVTIDDVVYVIDSGKVKEKSYDAVTGVTSMKSVRISQASAVQRKGRAGRVRPGVCYHLFSSYRFQNMEKYQVPEIVRMSAHELCLQSKLLAPNRPLVEFLSKLPDPPSQISIKNSIKLLKAIDALDPNENLTELGLLLLDLPIEPHLGKIILHSVVLKCLDPILTIVCSITYKDPFLIPANPRQKHLAKEAKEKLSSDSLSDQMVLLKAFQGWQKSKKDNFEVQFCQQNFISASTMEVIFGLRTQLLGQLRASGFVRARGPNDIRDLNTNSENWAVVKAALVAGYYPNVLRLNKIAKRARLFSRIESRVSFHPSSVLSMNGYLDVLKGSQSEWFVYEELARIGIAPYARMCTPVSPLAIAIFGGPCRLPTSNFTFDSRMLAEDESDSDDERHHEPYSIIKIDDWVSFKMKPEVASLVWQLRQKWQALFLRRMMSPNRQPPQSDCLVIKNLSDILFNEEQRLGLAQPIGVGQRPIPMATSYCSPVADSPSTLQQLQSPYQSGLRYPPFRMRGYGNRSPRGK